MREYDSFFHESIVETQYGPLVIHPIEDNRVMVESGHVYNSPGVKGTDGGFAIGQQRYGFMGNVCDNNGIWTVERDMTFDRQPWTATNKSAAPTHVAKMTAEIAAVVMKWARENGDILKRAQRAWQNNNLRIVDGRIEETEAKLTALRALRADMVLGIRRSPYEID